jgi:hypothetical protein
MEYREIVAVTGLGGLYQLLATKSDGAIVRNLADKTTKFISARLHNVTPLESIEIYTTGDNVRLHEVFQKMKDQEDTTSLPDAKNADSKTIVRYFKTVFPEIDDERVYVSDMKKILKWYEILKGADLLHFEALTNNEEETEAEEADANEEDNITPAADTSDTTGEEEKPVEKEHTEAESEVAGEEEKPKKAARKKKAEGDDAADGEEAPAKKTARKKKTEE